MELAKQQSAGGKSAEIRVTQEKKEQNDKGVMSAKIDNLKPDKHFFGADLVKEPLMKSKIE